MGRIYRIAIDGPAGAGKGTLARALGARYGFDHLDTGLLYRKVAALSRGKNAEECARALRLEDLKEEDLLGEALAQRASEISALQAVREALLPLQRRFACAPPGGRGAILDGRDIGVIVLPDADIKFYLTASEETRTKRLFLASEEQRKKTRGAGALPHDTPNLADIAAQVKIRDRRDASRTHAPMKKAETALLIDTTNLRIEAVLEKAINLADARLASLGFQGR